MTTTRRCWCCSVPQPNISGVNRYILCMLHLQMHVWETVSMVVFCYPATRAATHRLRRFMSVSGGWMLLCEELFTAEKSPHITTYTVPNTILLLPFCSCWCSSVLWHSPSLGVVMCCDTAQALVFLLVSVLWHSPNLGVLGGVSVFWHSPSFGVLARVLVCCDTAQALVFLLVPESVVTQPKPWCSCWCQCVVTQPKLWCSCWCSNVLWHSPSLGVLAGIKVLWHSPSLGVLPCVLVCCDTAQALVFLLVSEYVVTQPKPWCSCWCQCYDTTKHLVFLLVFQCFVTQPKPWCSCWC